MLKKMKSGITTFLEFILKNRFVGRTYSPVNPLYSSPPKSGWVTEAYEYKLISVNNVSEFNVELNESCEKGWEFIDDKNIEIIELNEKITYSLLLKRIRRKG